jgi:hypothetical protein
MTYTTPNTLLVHNEHGTNISVGDTVPTFRGEMVEIKGWRVGSHPGSTGRVLVSSPQNGWEQEFFPSVVEAHIISDDDATVCDLCGFVSIEGTMEQNAHDDLCGVIDDWNGDDLGDLDVLLSTALVPWDDDDLASDPEASAAFNEAIANAYIPFCGI